MFLLFESQAKKMLFGALTFQQKSMGTNIPLSLFLMFVYMCVALTSVSQIQTVNQLYLYLTVWAVLCLILDFQLQIRFRDHMLEELNENFEKYQQSQNEIQRSETKTKKSA